MHQIRDNYHHIDPGVTYIKQNIPCPIDLDDPESLHVNDLFEYELSESCQCTAECSSETKCPCIAKFGQNYQKDKILYSDDLILHPDNIDAPHIECGRRCKCPAKCGNRLVQYGPRLGLEIFDTKGKNLGLKSTLRIPKFSFVCEYAGEVLTPKLAKQRFEDNKLNSLMNYIFCLNEYTSGNQLTRTFIDPGKCGNIGRYLNHSCDPNCFIVPLRVDINVPKLCVFALRDVGVGEELTFDYGDGQQGEGTPCLCGERVCRGFLPFDIENSA